MNANLEAERNTRLLPEDLDIERRNFIKTMGLASVALSAGIKPGRTLAQNASSPAKEVNVYKPSSSNYMQVHKELVVIDGCTNLTGLDKDPQYLEWYKQGGATAIVLTVSSAVMAATSNIRHEDDTLDHLGYISRLLQNRDDPKLATGGGVASGKLGVIEEGAYADILLVNGDPLKDIAVLTKPEENLALIVKDGEIYKNATH